MRFHLKKTLTWTTSVLFFLVLTFNFYNHGVWQAHVARATVPWGHVSIAGKPIGHTNHHHDGTTEHGVRKSAANVTIGAVLEELKVTSAILSKKMNQYTNKDVVWPSHQFYDNDRIVNQLKYRPQRASKAASVTQEVPLKKILVFSGLGGWAVKRGRQTFVEQQCGVTTCELTDNREEASKADAVLFSHSPGRAAHTRRPDQIWILFMLESPYHTPGLGAFGGAYNWTATYRHDSDIVAPYEKFQPFDENVQFIKQNKSYATGKTKKVAWFVSNCGARNTRLEYAKKLGEYIEVDIYGSCGPKKCARKDNKCYEMLNTDYKFYLSFENSNCRDYITEKFFVTGLQ